jgi:glycosyltransferase involved in cell wall biosynthesis
MNESAAKKPIRVCFVMLKAYPVFNREVKEIFGGAEVDFYYLATELAKDRDYDVSCIVADYGQPAVEVRQEVALIKSVKNLQKYRLRDAWHLWRALHKADAQIYVRELSSLVTVECAVFTQLYRRKLVYRTAHTRECDGTYLRENWFIRGRAFAWALRHADKVITQNTDDVRQLYETIGVRADVIRGAHVLKPLDENPRETILWAARSATFKRPELFLKLARHMPDKHFTMICPKATDDDRYDEFVERAKQVQNLEFIPGVPFDKLEDYFNRAKVFVSTSSSEGFPNTYVHACKCATPILTLKVNPDNFISKYQCGMCADDNWNKFCEMLNMLLEPGTAERYGKNGRRYVDENHSIGKIIEDYKKIFQQLMIKELTE